MFNEASLIEAKMAPLHELHRLQKLTDCELTALFIIQVLAIRFPGQWLGAKRPRLEISFDLNFPLCELEFGPSVKKRLKGLSLGEVFAGFALKSTPEAVNRAILNWSTGAYPLELMFRIPSALEVLKQQKHGHRCVTVLTDATKISRPILGERDTLSFTMHDLIHADHFYHNSECYQGQLGLYGLLDHCKDDFQELLKNPEFHREFEYLIADMNAYAIHSLKCLKAAMLFYGPNNWFSTWASKFEVCDHLLALNTPTYNPHERDHLILQWLSQFRQF